MAADKPTKTTQTTDNDRPWKEALDFYFAEFLRLLAPWLHEQIDWKHTPVFLDKELQAITRKGLRGRRYADKLVRVLSTSQQPFFILVHVEVQGGAVGPAELATFSRRMYDYAYRIGDRYKNGIADHTGAIQPMKLVSLAVLTASQQRSTHLRYTWDSIQGANSGYFRFPVVHLARWLERYDELKQLGNTNPFAVLIMAQLQSQKAGKNERQKLISKTQIMRWLYAYRYSEKDTEQLFHLIDWLLLTPPELEAEFTQAITTIEQEHKMTYVNTVERYSLRRGKQEGEAGVLQRQLTRKFGPLATDLQQRIQTATSDQLEVWTLNILDAKTLDDVFKH